LTLQLLRLHNFTHQQCNNFFLFFLFCIYGFTRDITLFYPITVLPLGRPLPAPLFFILRTQSLPLSLLQSIIIFASFTLTRRVRSAQLLQLTTYYFNGTIPNTIGNLALHGLLDLNQNLFIGEIPPQLENLIMLEHLNLSHNMLSGFIQLDNRLNFYRFIIQ
jgi:hypothetical protein